MLKSLVVATVLCMVASMATAQDGPSIEDLEKQLEEQKIALQEAISNREDTAAKVAEVNAAIGESEEQKRTLKEELETLCEEKEALSAGSYDKCIASIDS